MFLPFVYSCPFIFCIFSTSVSVFLSFGVHPLPCSNYYIFFSVYLNMAQPSQSLFSYFLTYAWRTCPCSYFFIPDLCNPSYSIIHLNILVTVFSSRSCSALLSAQAQVLDVNLGTLTELEQLVTVAHHVICLSSIVMAQTRRLIHVWICEGIICQITRTLGALWVG